MNQLAILLAAIIVSMVAITGCSNDEPSSGEESRSGTNEHSREAESGEFASERSESGEDGEESGTQFGLGDTFDDVRAGARLILSYDSDANAFTGTVENTTESKLSRVRVEVHLSNGIELGPTTPVDLAAGEMAEVMLRGSNQSFETWSAHPEVGGGGAMESGEGGGEHGGSEGEGEGEHR